MEHPTKLKHRGLMTFCNFEAAERSTLSTKSASSKTQMLNCAI
ncbi:hypothetical protein D908_16629 [Vibrio mimicus CAIM 602]|nr:hypothetical protein D908_16629 [Vibrio mimicus CAIM 602]